MRSNSTKKRSETKVRFVFDPPSYILAFIYLYWYSVIICNVPQIKVRIATTLQLENLFILGYTGDIYMINL